MSMDENFKPLVISRPSCNICHDTYVEQKSLPLEPLRYGVCGWCISHLSPEMVQIAQRVADHRNKVVAEIRRK